MSEKRGREEALASVKPVGSDRWQWQDQPKIPTSHTENVLLGKPQSCGSGFNESGYGFGSSISSKYGSGTIRIQGFDDQKLQKKIQLKNCFNLFLIKNCNFLTVSLGLHKGLQVTGEAFSPQKNIQHFKKLNFLTFFYACGLFFPFWIRTQGPYRIRIQSGSGSTILKSRR